MSRIILLLAVTAIGLALGSGIALSAPAASPDARADSELQPKVVGGTSVPNDKYRYIAALLDKRISGGPFEQQFCGGTLIDPDSVLTAAHCMPVVNSNPRNLRVLLGRAQLNDGSRGVFRDVKRIFRHPNYSDVNGLHRDVAVLKLSRPVENIPKLNLAPISSGNRLEQPGSSAVVAGWGNTVQQQVSTSACKVGDRSFPQRMREARVPIRRDSYAAYVYNEFLPSNGVNCGRYVPQIMIAADKDGKGSCNGDSGGPLIKKVERNGKKVHIQIGVVSFSAGCGYNGFVGVYAEVNSKQISPFIKSAARK